MSKDKDRARVEALIADADAHDGFRANLEFMVNRTALCLSFYAGGVARQLTPDSDLYVELWNFPGKDSNPGPQDRVNWLMAAMCRFVNTGGQVSDIVRLAQQFQAMAGTSNFQIPGFELFESYHDTEGVFNHVFTSENSHHAIRWVEDEYIEVVSLEQLRKEMESIDATDIPATADAGTGSGQNLLGEDDHEDPSSH